MEILFFKIMSKIKVTKEVFFDISIDGEAAGKLRIGLFGNVVPRTCENIAQLAARTEVDIKYVVTRINNISKANLLLFSSNPRCY